MTIVLPSQYHAQAELEKNRVICIPHEEALRQDIRALRIGILNIMPEAKSYEFSLLHPLGRSVLQIIPVWIKLQSHQYFSTAKHHLETTYVHFDQVATNVQLDGMIVTGAPVEHLPFPEVRYWEEIKEILLYCRKHVPSTLGICWGGMALAYLLGLEKRPLGQKLFGVFETENLLRSHPITGGLDDVFWLPQSRCAGCDNTAVEELHTAKELKLLAKIVGGDYPIMESSDGRYLMNLGHFEYDGQRFFEEYQRDLQRENAQLPVNIDLQKPVNRWRGQRNEFFHQWLRYCHDVTHGHKVAAL